MKTFTLLCCLSAAVVFTQAQDTIYVTAGSSIQAAIDTAVPGNIILVADGTYSEQINFLGKKPLTVASWYLRDGNEDHIDNTIIDGDGIDYPNPDSCSLVYFVNDEDTTSVLYGFTIQHGKGTHLHDIYTSWSGGGIFVLGAGAKIVYNHITENHLSDTVTEANTQLALGAGIAAGGNDEVNKWIVIDHNLIEQNSLYSENMQAAGAGLFIENLNVVISNNTISGNLCTSMDGSMGALAGGFMIHCLVQEDANILIRSNIFKNNMTLGENGAWASTACGYVENVPLIFTDNLVENNECQTSHIYAPGGIMSEYNPGPGSIIRNNTFNVNETNNSGGGFYTQYNAGGPDDQITLIENNYFFGNEAYMGGAVFSRNVPVLLQNNVFSGNSSSNNGGAGYFMSGAFEPEIHLVTMINNTFSGNHSEGQGEAIYSNNAKPLIINSILWGDSTNQEGEYEIYLNNSNDDLEIAYSDIDPAKIYGTWTDGGGNINKDPLFIDPETLEIDSLSQCFNTGTASFTCACGVTNYSPNYDILGNERPYDEMFDLGAYEWVLPIGIPVFDQNRIKTGIYPNPFTTSTTIKYNLEKNAFVTVSVFDMQGRLIDMPFMGWQQQGEHRITLDAADLPDGTYFYHVQAGSERGSGKMVVGR